MHRKTNEQGSSKYKRRLGLRTKLFIALGALCTFTIAVLWVFQLVFMDDFYYYVTLDSISDAASSYTKVNYEDLVDYTEGLADDKNVNVSVYSQSTELITSSSERKNSIVGHFSSEMVGDFIKKAENNGGKYVYIFDLFDIAVGDDEHLPTIDTNDTPPLLPDADMGIVQHPKPQTREEDSVVSKRLIYATIQKTSDDSEIFLIFDCSLTPVSTVSETITLQLTIITALCIIAAIVISLILSYKVSRPISDINKNAKMLAEGKYDVVFNGGGCREIDELSSTLGYAASELSKIESMQNELISNISHDLRTPLTMIGGYAEIMRDIPGENTAENLQVIIDETQRLNSLVNNLLLVSKSQEQAKMLKREVFSLSELLGETVHRFEKMKACKGYSFSVSISENVMINADKEKITQVLYNLIGNAVNYTGEDKKIVIKQTASADTVRIDIIDSGEGIPAEDLPYIWQRYYRADSFHRRSELGMGIGLSIVKDILQAHNAAFGVISTVGKGSDFWFKLHTVNE